MEESTITCTTFINADVALVICAPERGICWRLRCLADWPDHSLSGNQKPYGESDFVSLDNHPLVRLCGFMKQAKIPAHTS
jgi:hypothetical protein